MIRALINKKGMVPLLAAIAFGIWAFNAFSLRERLAPDKTAAAKEHASVQLQAWTNREALEYDVNGRDPFRPFFLKETRQARPAERTPTQSAPVALPELVLDGIIWDAEHPMAIINSSSVTTGAKIGDATVKRIYEDRVDIEYKGRTYTIQ